jgi:hypothetical protein
VIDTLKLSLTDYSILLGADLTIQPAAHNHATGEMTANFKLWNSGDRWVEGSKAFHNADDFNVSIKPGHSANNDGVLAMVQFSVPKVADGSNYHPTDEKGTKVALRGIESRLRAIGIRTNIESATLSRLDAFKTVEADEPYECYHPVLSMIRGRRMAKRDYGTTFLWANTMQEICAYDKRAEMQLRKVPLDGVAKNPLRFEWRMLKASKVRESLDGMRTVKDLTAGYDQVRVKFVETMEKQLFPATAREVATVTTSEIEKQLLALREQGGRRYWFDDWLKARGLAAVIGNLDAVEQAVKLVSDNRATQLKIMRKLKAAQMDAMTMKIIGPSQRTLAELYSELKTKVLQ